MKKNATKKKRGKKKQKKVKGGIIVFEHIYGSINILFCINVNCLVNYDTVTKSNVSIGFQGGKKIRKRLVFFCISHKDKKG